MRIPEDLLNRLGTYFSYHEIDKQFGLTFEAYCFKYLHDPSACTVEQLRQK